MQIKKYLGKSLIFLLLLVAGLPFGFISASGAQAKGENVGTTTTQPTIQPPSFELIKGLLDSYQPGQSIMATVVYAGKATSVRANIGNLDPTFSQTVALKNKGDGAWQLTTPILTENLNAGDRKIEISAENSSGISSKIFWVNLKARVIGKLPVRYAAGKNDIKLSWSAASKSDQYVIKWGLAGTSTPNYKIIKNCSVVLSDLDSASRYEITVKSLDEDGKILARGDLSLRTGGQTKAPVVETNTRKVITPSIGTGVSTQAPRVAQGSQKQAVNNPTPTPNSTISPTPSESPKSSGEKEGWNRLLVALGILIIAAGAAIGGYYGYEWYASRGQGNRPDSKSSNRW